MVLVDLRVRTRDGRGTLKQRESTVQYAAFQIWNRDFSLGNSSLRLNWLRIGFTTNPYTIKRSVYGETVEGVSTVLHAGLLKYSQRDRSRWIFSSHICGEGHTANESRYSKN
jgi:hypothetical protein